LVMGRVGIMGAGRLLLRDGLGAGTSGVRARERFSIFDLGLIETREGGKCTRA
jgi:hypothetical protein